MGKISSCLMDRVVGDGDGDGDADVDGRRRHKNEASKGNHE